MLYSYCLRYDDGAAPNPFWGVCTLAICKPAIRRTAQAGDWVVGTGSVRSPGGSSAGRVVYAMRVSKVLSMPDYDAWTRAKRPAKVPDWTSRDHRRRLGDSIYDFSEEPPALRPSVHGANEVRTDLSGRNVLVSNHFFYFGNGAVPLPERLLPIVHQGRGHRSWMNEPYTDAFVAWLERLSVSPGVHGEPQMDLFAHGAESCGGSVHGSACSDVLTAAPIGSRCG